jgi:hypothetical protein
MMRFLDRCWREVATKMIVERKLRQKKAVMQLHKRRNYFGG